MKEKVKKSLLLMVSLIFVFFTFAAISANAQTGWYKLSSPTTMDLHAVCFKDANNGCVIGEDIILRTTNGGLSWTEAGFPFGENSYFTFESLCYTNATTGWIAGDVFINPPGQHSKVILKTTNAGSNWEVSYVSQSDTGLISICYKTPDSGFSVGGAEILKSTNNGLNWNSYYYFEGENDYFSFNSVCFTNLNTGYAAGTHYYGFFGLNPSKIIIKTTDGGNNWFSAYSGGANETGINSINFCNTNTGWAVGGNKLLSTANGGQNWTSIIFAGLNQIYSLEHIYFSDPLHGWISGGYVNTFGNEHSYLIIKTSDGGQTWTQQMYSNGQSNDYKLNSVYFIDNLTGWAVGDGGAIFKTIDGGMTGISSVGTTTFDSYNLFQNYPNPFNPKTIINYQLPSSNFVKLVVYGVTGKEVAVLVNKQLQPGKYEVEFDGSNLPSGVYFYNLQAGDFTETKKMLFVK